MKTKTNGSTRSQYNAPPLATLRAMYPVVSGSLTAAEIAAISVRTMAFSDVLFSLSKARQESYIERTYANRATRLDTPIKRAAFALLLTMIDAD